MFEDLKMLKSTLSIVIFLVRKLLRTKIELSSNKGLPYLDINSSCTLMFGFYRK